jgi:hypothetical protein
MKILDVDLVWLSHISENIKVTLNLLTYFTYKTQNDFKKLLFWVIVQFGSNKKNKKLINN